jgi:hypothetical protein
MPTESTRQVHIVRNEFAMLVEQCRTALKDRAEECDRGDTDAPMTPKRRIGKGIGPLSIADKLQLAKEARKWTPCRLERSF